MKKSDMEVPAMEFPLTDEERSIQQMVREFVDAEVRPGARERDEAGRFPYGLYRRLGELGITGLSFPEAYGGSGGSAMSLVLAVEEISRADQSLAVSLFVTTNVAGILRDAATEEQKQRWMTPLVQGTHIAAFGLTEPEGGSDNQSMKTTAVLEDGEWVINGSKAFITNSGTDITLFTLVFCVTGRRQNGKKEFSTILVPSGTPGLIVEPAYRKLGWRSSDTHPLTFVNCRVPYGNLVGERGEGLRHALGALQFGRVVIAASAVGLAEGCLDECLQYARSRHAFNRPLGAFQGYQFQIADMATMVEAARLMVYQATRMYEAGRLTRKAASMTKLFATEVAQRVAVMAVDLFGGAGFIEESNVARYYRDVKVNTIGDGAANIHRSIIARELGFPPAF